MKKLKCNIHTVELGKKTYFVFVGVKNYRVIKVFVWRKKDNFFYLGNHKIDNHKAKMFTEGDRIDFHYVRQGGDKTTFEGLDRYHNEHPHEQEFNSLLPDLDKAVKYLNTLKLKEMKDYKKCINKIFNSK